MMTSGNSARRVGICGSPFLGIVREGRCSIISHIVRRQIPVYSHGLMEIVMAGDAEYIRNPVGMDHGRGDIVDYSKLQTRVVLYRKMRAGVGSITLQLRKVRPLHVSLPLPQRGHSSRNLSPCSTSEVPAPLTKSRNVQTNDTLSLTMILMQSHRQPPPRLATRSQSSLSARNPSVPHSGSAYPASTVKHREAEMPIDMHMGQRYIPRHAQRRERISSPGGGMLLTRFGTVCCYTTRGSLGAVWATTTYQAHPSSPRSVRRAQLDDTHN